MDSGNTWYAIVKHFKLTELTCRVYRNLDYGSGSGVSGGKVALSANGDTVLWSTDGNGTQVSQYTNAFTLVPSLPAGAAIASDKKVNSIFYGASGDSFYLSTDGGKTFAATATLGNSSTPNTVIVHPNVTGDVWVSTDTGLFHSLNNGTTFTSISGVSQVCRVLECCL